MSPRSSAAGARRTREAIVQAAVLRASVQGLDGMSIGELARDVGLSKAGLIGPFGSKQALQLETFARGVELFRRTVWDPAAAEPAGLMRLRAVCRHWFAYLVDPPLPGGCLMTTVSVEWDARPGPLQQAAAAQQRRWLAALAGEVHAAVRAHELPPDRDPVATAFAVNAVGLGLNQAVQLLGDTGARAHAQAAIDRLL